MGVGADAGAASAKIIAVRIIVIPYLSAGASSAVVFRLNHGSVANGSKRPNSDA
jgi:hypothetical protein